MCNLAELLIEWALFLLDINEDDLKKSEKFCLEKGLLEKSLLQER